MRRSNDVISNNSPSRRSFIKNIGALAAGVGMTASTAALAAQGQTNAEPKTNQTQLGARFKDQIVVITGATSGIGEGTAKAFAAEGAMVFFNGRRADLGKKVERDIRQAGGEATYMQSDVRDEKQVKAFIDAAVNRYGRIDIAFNNAGVVFGNDKLKGNAPLSDIDVADFDDVWNTNTRGLFLSMKHEIAQMIKNSPQGRGSVRGVIINNSSVSAHGGFPGISPYSVSKHGVLGLTRGGALDYGKDGIRVVAVSPGGVDTPMRRAAIRAQGMDPQDAHAPNISHRTNSIDEIADIVLFLASKEAPTAIQGTDIDVTMGMLTGPFSPPK